MTRREILAAFLGLPAALAAGCSRSPALPTAGGFAGPSVGLGHRLRDGVRPQPSDDAWQGIGVAIVGGGIAGLTAAWRLRQAGYDDFVILELEPRPGGTSCSGDSPVTPFPWGAHYLPLPIAANGPLVTLLDEMGVLEGRTPEGEPIAAEQFLCRDPQERLFHGGRWTEGLYPYHGVTAEDLAQLAAFEREVERWVVWRDGRGRRAFTIPAALGSDDAEVTALDRMTMAEWLDRRGWRSPRLRWVIDYACRDDYGLRAEQTSAWAGLFYFASRTRRPGDDSQPFLTWPEGNGRLVAHLARSAEGRMRLGQAVADVRPTSRSDEGAEVVTVDSEGRAVGYRAGRVLFAAPQFLAPHLIRGYRTDRGDTAAAFEYGSWLVANLSLSGRPRETGFPLAWDNVLYESPSLGYVAATHQRGQDYGPTVFTYYYALCDERPSSARSRLLSLGWSDWADVVLTDIETAHPEIRSLTTRLDLMRWGHAMIRPRPGFVWGEERRAAAEPYCGIHFAHSDLSGVALFEEAFYHGIRAAEEVLAAVGRSVEPMYGGAA